MQANLQLSLNSPSFLSCPSCALPGTPTCFALINGRNARVEEGWARRKLQARTGQEPGGLERKKKVWLQV